MVIPKTSLAKPVYVYAVVERLDDLFKKQIYIEYHETLYNDIPLIITKFYSAETSWGSCPPPRLPLLPPCASPSTHALQTDLSTTLLMVQA